MKSSREKWLNLHLDISLIIFSSSHHTCFPWTIITHSAQQGKQWTYYRTKSFNLRVSKLCRKQRESSLPALPNHALKVICPHWVFTKSITLLQLYDQDNEEYVVQVQLCDPQVDQEYSKHLQIWSGGCAKIISVTLEPNLNCLAGCALFLTKLRCQCIIWGSRICTRIWGYVYVGSPF